MIQATIRVYHPESSHGFYGVRVGLSYSPPDGVEISLARGRTNRQGIANLSFPKSTTLLAGHLVTITITLYNSLGGADHAINRTLILRSPTSISIPINLELASQLGYYRPKRQRTRAQKTRGWCKKWTERIEKFKDPIDLDGLCFSQMVLETLAGVNNPQTRLQSDAFQRLSGQLSKTQLQKVASYAAQAQKTMQDCKLPGLEACAPGASVEDFAQRVFLTRGGSGYGLYQALAFRAPDPEANIGNPQKGQGIPIDFEWDKDCKAWYDDGSLTGQGRTDMDQYFPDQLKVLAKPSVNRIEIWDPVLQNITRIGHVPEKELEVQELDIREGGVRSTIVPMNVDLDDEQCLVLEGDADGRQVLVVDIRPGQKVTLMGSGFVSAQATLNADVREWTVLLDGRIQPRNAVLPIPGFDNTILDVHGSSSAPLPDQSPETYFNDLIIFTWPEAASREGLYRVTLSFKNESDYFSSAIQDPTNCTLSLSMEDVQAQTLYFAVLPAVTARRARMVASRVECIDETNPETFAFLNLADDVAYTAQATLSKLIFDPATQQPRDESTALAPRSGEHQFWEDGTNWNPGLQAFPDANGSFQFIQLDELVFVLLRAAEVEGDLDRAIAYAVSIAIIVAIVVVVSAIIVVIVAVVISANLVTAAVASALLIPVTIAVIGFLFGPAFTAALAGIERVELAVSGEDPLISIVSIFSGQEIAHQLSPIRFHHILFTGQRPPSEERVSSSLEDGALQEIFESTALGGTYRFHLRVETT